MIGETYVKLEICRKKLSTKIIVTNDVVQPIIIELEFLQTYRGILYFAEQQVILTHPDSIKVKVEILSSNYEDENNQNKCFKTIYNKEDLFINKVDAFLPTFHKPPPLLYIKTKSFNIMKT